MTSQARILTTVVALLILMAPYRARAGDLNPPPGPIAPTNRVQLNAQAITLPFTINQSGSYVLTSNLTGVIGQAGIIVAADNVTIDLNGFTLQGVPGGSLDGIRPSGLRRNMTVVNGFVAGWDGHGITGYFNIGLGDNICDNMRIEGVTVSGNGNIGILGRTGSLVRGCIAEGNGAGGIFTQNAGGIVENCVARGNAGVGISIVDGAVVTGCAALNNTGSGIATGNGEITVVNCTAAGNGGHGIHAGSVGRVTIRGCMLKFNTGDGINVLSDSFVVENNSILNTAAGVHVGLSGNRIEANNVVSNTRGIDVDAGGNLIIRNSAKNNGTNYDIVGVNTVGPTVNAANIATSDNPHANYDF